MTSHASTLLDQPQGDYRFLPGIIPFSSGVVARTGFEIVHATLARPVPWRRGFDFIAGHLARLGRPRQALCAIELRSPTQFTFQGFDEFNLGYRALLESWGLLVNGANPVARTNVVPVVRPPAEPSLYAFSYTVPGGSREPSFVSAGAGEIRPGTAGPPGIVRRGETSASALREKAAVVMDVMATRLKGLGGDWGDVSVIDVYTAYDVTPLLPDLGERVGLASIHGIHLYPSRPPIVELEFEVDLRGLRSELHLDPEA